MVKYCAFCNKIIKRKSLNNPSVSWKVIYCSDICNKRAYYVRNLGPEQRSNFINSKDWEDTETGRGTVWEKFVAKLLKAEWQGFNKSYDLLWNGKKIDVKVGSLYKRKFKAGKPVDISKQSGWFVFDKHGEKKIDYLFCIGLINEAPHKMWLIPYNKVGKSFTITPNKSKKFDKYIFSL